ncbi:MAG: hypothetical protein CMH57_06615 [Myxococcales bacterium]|nr:hypothetical protein [Myxococcales bacterium]
MGKVSDDKYDEGAFFDDGIDPELEALPTQINWFRPVLMIVVIFFAGWVVTKFQTELEYFFSSTEPIPLGAATDFADDPDQKKLTEIPHNRYVSIDGIPTRGSLSCDPAVRYFKLIGEHIYVEEPVEEELSAIACRARSKEANPKVNTAPIFSGAGRAVHFEQLGNRYNGFLTFYERSYEDRFCATMTPAKKEARLKFLRQLLREQIKAEKGNYPPDAEVERLLAGERLCVRAVLIQAGEAPHSFWPYLAVCIVLGLIILWNVYLLVTWTRRTIALTR